MEGRLECFYHPGTETALRCGKCERPICARCVVFTPVGARCRECARLRRLPTYTLTPLYLARAAGAAVVAGIVLGVGLALLLAFRLVPWPLTWIVPPLGLVASGYLVGEAVSLATNRKRGPVLQGIAVAGFVLCYLLLELVTSALLIGSLYVIIGLIAGVALALGRLR
jgi:hypothetical protein